MAILPIVTGKDTPVLRKKTKRVPGVTKELRKLIKDMMETMKAAPGVGLAAPQVGESVRVCIVTMNDKPVALINPDITWRSAETYVDEEGCLSLPGIWLPVTRPKEIIVQYTDEKGKPQERKLELFDARVVQHEVDHLEGILITDYAESLPTALTRREKQTEKL